jgi:hypothetical protein
MYEECAFAVRPVRVERHQERRVHVLNAILKRGRAGGTAVTRERIRYVDTDRLKGGGAPEDDTEPTDPRLLAELIHRGAPPRASGTAIERDGTVVYAEEEGE